MPQIPSPLDSFSLSGPTPNRPTFLGQLTSLLAQSGSETPAAVGVVGDLPTAADGPDPTTVSTLEGLEGDVPFELFVKPIEHPRELIGFWAPQEWSAFGVVTTGTARPFAPHPSAAGSARDGNGERVSIAHIVDRSGAECSELWNPATGHGYSNAATGAVPEICRRVLGLPTAAPESTTATLLAHQWLERVLETRLDADLAHPKLSWVEVAGCCAFLGTDPADSSPIAITAHGLDIVEQWPWAIIRREATLAELPLFDIWPGDAAWMDDGMFAREVLANQAPLHQVFSDLAELLPGSVFRHITRILDVWGVDPFYDRVV